RPVRRRGACAGSPRPARRGGGRYRLSELNPQGERPMGMNAFLTLPGIKGSARQKDREGKIVVSGVVHEVVSDLDFAPQTVITRRRGPEAIGTVRLVNSVVKAGDATHKPLVVTKDLDQSSPLLHGAMGLKDSKSATVFPEVTIEFWRMPPSGGIEENHFTITL